jgi:cytochrome c554/c'-like protein
VSRATKPKGPRARPGAEPVRPKKLLERPWPWMILAGLIGGAIVALALSMLKSAQEDGGDSGSAFLLLAGTGLAGVTLMLLTAFYSARKRRRALQEHMPGTMMTWLKAHVWLGLAAAFAILVHWWLYPINSRITTGKITLAILIVLVVSGIAWRIVYVSVPRRIPGKVGNLSVKDTRSRRDQIDVEIEKTLAGASDDLRRLSEELLRGKTRVGELDARAATLAVREQAAWQELRALAERLERYRGREPKQERYHRMLQGWKLLHLPLAVALGAAIAVHVWDVLGIGNRVFADEAQAFPDSGQCADCHSDIVREWNLAVHSVAQTSPTTVAQTALALQLDPNIGPLCTNCHAPIGMQITPKDTFPLPGEGGDAVVSEGITCWTCHSVSEIPGELRGAEEGFPVGRAGARDFGTVFGPPLGGDPPLPVPDHQTAQGFMTKELTTFQLCGSCHNVKADLDGDGFSPFGDQQSDESANDEDGDGKLDENELVEVDEDGNGFADPIDVDGSGLIPDLVLQTTFDEWEDYLANDQAGAPCAECHMPSSTGPAVDDAPGNLDLPDRTLHSHTFVGVDYDLERGHYAGLGVGGGDATEEVLDLRQRLIDSGVSIQAEVRQQDVSPDFLLAEVTVRSDLIGHDFPTGFAFARQWWLEVSATTSDGEPVCLTPIDPVAKLPDPNGIPSPCSSGTIAKASEDLKPCDPIEVADRFGTVLNATVQIATPSPLEDCDPWLANFQKILTDGDPDADGTFVEVPYQSLQPDIVKNQIRVADQLPMVALKPYDDKVNTPGVDDRERTLVYLFDVSDVRGQQVTVNVVMHLRHLPPYFLRALDGFYPNGLTAKILLQQMVVSDIQGASSDPVRVP